MSPSRIDKAALKFGVQPRKEDRSEENALKAHSAFVRSLQICVAASFRPEPCSGRIESCHIRQGFNTMARKPKAAEVPMCSGHHALQHRVGEKAFFGALIGAVKRLGANIWKVTGDQPAALKLIQTWRTA